MYVQHSLSPNDQVANNVPNENMSPPLERYYTGDVARNGIFRIMSVTFEAHLEAATAQSIADFPAPTTTTFLSATTEESRNSDECIASFLGLFGVLYIPVQMTQ